MTEKCIICDKEAVWVRSTQFAGEHPYCEEHAKLESDFGQNDSYGFWYKIFSDPESKNLESSA